MKKIICIKFILLVIVVGLASFSDYSFAVDVHDDVMYVASLGLKLTVNILQWLWIPIAKWAGILLTNSMVYGELFGLDVVLWSFWNVMKNLANFTLGFYFIYLIFQNLYNVKSGKDIGDFFKKKILWLFIAGLGIQASWFLTAVVLDLSTVSLVAAGSFSSQMISNTEGLDLAIENAGKNFFNSNENDVITYTGMKITLFPTTQKASDFVSIQAEKLEKPVEKKDFYDLITPGTGSVEGPLMYLGLMILKTHWSTSMDTSTDNSIKKTLINTIIQGGTTIVFAIEMFVLCMVAFMRLFYLRLFIIISPFVVLLYCLEKSMSKKIDIGFLKTINLNTFFWNVFRPSVIVLGISAALMFSTLMNELIVSNSSGKEMDATMKGVTFSSRTQPTNNSNGSDHMFLTTMDSNPLGVSVSGMGKTLMEFILSIVTVMLIFVIIKFAINLGSENGDFVSKTAKKWQSIAGGAMSTIPLAPVIRKDSSGNYQKVGNLTIGNLGGKYFGIGNNEKNIITNLETKNSKFIRKVYGEERQKQDKILDDIFGKSGLSYAEKNLIEKAIQQKNITEIKNSIARGEIKDGRMFVGQRATGEDSFWQNKFVEWLNADELNKYSPGTDLYVILKVRKELNEEKKKDTTKAMAELFGNSDVRQAYVRFFGLSNADNLTWDQLQQIDISAN